MLLVLPAAQCCKNILISLREQYQIDATIVNGENSADGRGITPRIMDII